MPFLHNRFVGRVGHVGRQSPWPATARFCRGSVVSSLSSSRTKDTGASHFVGGGGNPCLNEMKSSRGHQKWVLIRHPKNLRYLARRRCRRQQFPVGVYGTTN